MSVLIWGTADTAKKLMCSDLKNECIGFIESIKTNDSFMSLPIYAPNKISEIDYDCIVVTSSRYCEEIYQKCLEEKIEMTKVLFFNKFRREKWYENAELKARILGEELFKEYVDNQMKSQCYGQFGQDSMAYDLQAYFRMKKGVYIDIGAFDGVCFSNTKKFEELGWDGICIEPNPDAFAKLEQNRKSINVNAAISERNGIGEFVKVDGQASMLSGLAETFDEEHKNRIEKETCDLNVDSTKIEVQMYSFDEIMNKYMSGITSIDFVSIDVEGGEFAILKNIDFDKYKINMLVVERNYDEETVHKYMSEKGFTVISSVIDDFFIRKAWVNEF